MNSSRVAELVQKATSNSLTGPDHETCQIIVKEINSRGDNSKVVAQTLRQQIMTNQPKVIFLSLGLLDLAMDKCGNALHTQICTKEFMHTLVAMLNTPNMPKEIQQKILYLIQKWGIRFEKYRDILPLFTDVYNALKKNNVQFPPMNAQSASQGSNQSSNSAGVGKSSSQSPEVLMKKVPQKFHKLVHDMNLVKGNVNFTNEIIDSSTPAEAKTDETLRDLIKTLTDMEPKLFQLISKVDNEEVLNVCLLVNDDLQKTFSRYNNLRDGKKVEAFIPGESIKNTCLNPTHIYTKDSGNNNNSSSSSSNPVSNQAQKQPSAPQQSTDDLLLLDFGSSPAQQQQQPQRQQQQMPPQQNQFQTQQPRPQQQQQQQQQQPAPKKDDPISQLNEIMARMTTNSAPQQQQQQMPNQFATNQMPMNANQFASNMPNMNMNMMGGMNNMQMPNMGMGGGANPFATNPNPMMNMNTVGFTPSQPSQNNPFGGATPFQTAQQQPVKPSQYAAPSYGGPSADSWAKDGASMFGPQSSQKRDENKNDQVQEFKDLFSLADVKIKTKTQQKPAVDLTYKPVNMPAQQTQQQSPPMQQEQQQQQQPLLQQQQQPTTDVFAMPSQASPAQQQEQQPQTQNNATDDFFGNSSAQSQPAPEQQQQQQQNTDLFAMPAQQQQQQQQPADDPFNFGGDSNQAQPQMQQQDNSQQNNNGQQQEQQDLFDMFA